MKTLQPRIKLLDPLKARGVKTTSDLPRRNGYPVKPPARWTKDGNGRTLSLNSAAWKRLRAQVLAEVPLCEYCPPGTVTPATEVDHKNNNPADNSRANLVSACKSCHSRKTASDMHGNVARMGCDAEGNPINPAHSWNQAAVGRSGASGEGEDGAQEIARDKRPETDWFPPFQR